MRKKKIRGAGGEALAYHVLPRESYFHWIKADYGFCKHIANDDCGAIIRVAIAKSADFAGPNFLKSDRSRHLGILASLTSAYKTPLTIEL